MKKIISLGIALFVGLGFAFADEDVKPVTLLSAYELSDLKVDGTTVAGFQPSGYDYSVTGGVEITDATAIKNMGITILPRDDESESAYVVTMSEDGQSSALYTVEMHHHAFSMWVTNAPTCTVDGSRSRTCAGCDTVEQEVIPALGHDWDEGIVIQEATEEAAGLRRVTCRRCDATDDVEIPRIITIAALRNVAVVTAVGTAPELPAKVAGLEADGAVGGEFAVDWGSPVVPTAVGVTTVNGTAEVNGSSLPVTASVRAVSSEVVNHSPEAIETTEANILKGTIDRSYLKKYLYLTTKAADPLTSGVWDDLICYGNEVEVTIEWTSPVSVSKVRVYFQQDGNYVPPGNVKFYNESGAEIAWTDGDDNDNGGAGSWHDYVFTAPQTLSKLRFYQKRDASQHSLFLRRVWAIGSVGSTKPLSADTLSALAVDNVPVPGFSPTTYGYAVAGANGITSATSTDNMGITILPKHKDSARAVTLAEDGTSTKTYTVSLSSEPPVQPEEKYTITLDARGGSVAQTTYEYTTGGDDVLLPTPTRTGYHFVGWFKDDVARYVEKLYPNMVNNLYLYPLGKYLFGTPVTAVSADNAADMQLYAKWVKNEVYEHFRGKKAVFVGDSVTTLAGHEARNEYPYTAVHYTAATCANYEINETTTWGGQLAQALDMDFLSVNAVSGSPVADNSTPAAGPRAISCVKRINDLAINGTPDVIFILGGINDFNGNGAPVDDFDPDAAYLAGELDLTSNTFDSFAEGYATMIRRIRHYYPTTEIVALQPFVDGDANVYAKGCKTIADLCAYFQVASIDLRDSGLPAHWEDGVALMMDGLHPNAIGFTALANCVLENYEPACAHANRSETTGAKAATCTEDGYTGDFECLDCGNTVYGQVIPALGHDWGEGDGWVVTLEPTETEPGSKRRECLRDGCDYEEVEEIPATGGVTGLVVTSLSDEFPLTDGAFDPAKLTQGTLRWALANAQEGDTIVFADSIKGGTINMVGVADVTPNQDTSFVIAHALTIEGNGVTINGGWDHGVGNGNKTGTRIFLTAAGQGKTTIKNLNLVNGRGAVWYGPKTAYLGGAVNAGSPLRLENCQLVNNSTMDWIEYSYAYPDHRGGGAISAESDLEIVSCFFGTNSIPGGTGSYGGAIRQMGGSLTVSDTVFDHDYTKTFGGGALYLGSAVTGATFTNCSFLENASSGASDTGGAIYSEMSAGAMKFFGCVLRGGSNGNSSNGGGIRVKNAVEFTAVNCEFSDCNAKLGGVMHGSVSNPLFVNCTFYGNAASTWGSAFEVFSPTYLVNCTIAGSYLYGKDDGITYVASKLTLLNTVFAYNYYGASSATSGDGYNQGLERICSLYKGTSSVPSIPTYTLATSLDNVDSATKLFADYEMVSTRHGDAQDTRANLPATVLMPKLGDDTYSTRVVEIDPEGVLASGGYPVRVNADYSYVEYSADGGKSWTQLVKRDGASTDNLTQIAADQRGVPYKDGLTPIGAATLAPSCRHEHTTTNGYVAATCTEPGDTGVITCEDCGVTLCDHAVIAALGHDWDKWTVTKEASKTEDGLRERNCRRDGCDAHEEEVIPMIVDIAALRNIAVVTAVGVAPTLPAKVVGLKADGTVGGEYEVVWSSADAPTSAGITTVTGTAQVNGAEMTVTASVRAANASSGGGEPVNYSPSATFCDAKANVKVNDKEVLRNDTSVVGSDNHWDSFVCYNNGEGDMELSLGWDSPVVVSEVHIYFSQSGNYQGPDNVRFFDDSGASPVAIMNFTAGDIVDRDTAYAHIVYTFATPQTLSKIRFVATAEGELSNRYLLVRRMWVFGSGSGGGSGGSADPTSTDTLTALAVDGTEVADFAPTTYGYEVKGGEKITLAENDTDNVGITILPKYEGSAYVVTLAEDGESTKTYTVAMPSEPPQADYPSYIPDDPVAKGKWDAWIEGKTVDDPETEDIRDAFLLACDPSAVAEERAAFMITSIEFVEGEWVVKVEDSGDGDAYRNGFIRIIEHSIDGAGEDARFFKAELVVTVVADAPLRLSK